MVLYMAFAPNPRPINPKYAQVKLLYQIGHGVLLLRLRDCIKMAGGKTSKYYAGILNNAAIQNKQAKKPT